MLHFVKYVEYHQICFWSCKSSQVKETKYLSSNIHEFIKACCHILKVSWFHSFLYPSILISVPSWEPKAAVKEKKKHLYWWTIKKLGIVLSKVTIMWKQTNKRKNKPTKVGIYKNAWNSNTPNLFYWFNYRKCRTLTEYTYIDMPQI